MDVIAYSLAKRALLRALPKLSVLEIDVDKDWSGRSISNINTLSAINVYVGDLMFKHGWRLFETNEALYLRKDNKIFRLVLEEVK